VLGSQIWPPTRTTLQAAVRFEVRLAEDQPGPGLREARAAGSDRLVYLYPEIVVTNDDIAQCRVVPGNGPSRFDVSVEFNASGREKMRQATAGHVGRPVAILIDGVVVMAPVLRSPIAESAVITGDYTRAEAERIVNGVGLR
jgi:preprotein translocase subunit SecD